MIFAWIREKRKEEERLVVTAGGLIDQAVACAPRSFRERQYPAKPRPAKPSSIIAQVEGSGTPPTSELAVIVRSQTAGGSALSGRLAGGSASAVSVISKAGMVSV